MMMSLAGHLFPYQANGSLLERDGKIVGSEPIRRNFTSGVYCHGRPSSTIDVRPGPGECRLISRIQAGSRKPTSLSD